MKKFVVASIVLCLLAAVGVAVYFLLPKRATEIDLVIDAKTQTVEAGETKVLEYSCSIKDAIITYKVADESIATVRASGAGVEIVGIMIGETDLTLSGKYKDKTFEKTVKILVVSASVEDPSDGGNVGDGGDDANQGGGNQEEGNDTPNDDPESGKEPDVVPEVIFPSENMINCSVSGNVIEISCNKNAAFSISSNINLTKVVKFEIGTEFVTITADTYVGGNTFKIIGSAVGEYEITIILEEKYEFTYIVRVSLT